MKKILSCTVVGLTIITMSFFSSCGGGKKDNSGRTDTPTSGTITFYADESFSPVIKELVSQFEFQYPKAHLNGVYTDEITGLQMLKDRKTCLLITSRALTKNEIAYFKTKQVIPEIFPICYDGLALIVNRNNPDTCITVENVKKVLSGQITEWSQLGGTQKGKIEVVFDNKRSATLNYVVDSLLDGKPINSPNIVAAKNSKAVVDYVDATPNAIGVIGSNWLNDKRDTTNTTFKKNIHVMSVSIQKVATPMNSWKPYQAYLLDGRYPFVRTIYCLLIDPRRGLPNSFANYCANPQGQLLLFHAGMLPARGDITIRTVDVKR